jgi:uncharacterized membrane protein YphA (DoxX/SURF4 family)
VAGVLICAAFEKIWTPLEFARLLKEYQILPDQVLNLVAVLLPWVEIICGVCFPSGLWLMGAAVLLSGMNIIFTFAIISHFISVSENKLPSQTVRDVFFMHLRQAIHNHLPSNSMYFFIDKIE